MLGLAVALPAASRIALAPQGQDLVLNNAKIWAGAGVSWSGDQVVVLDGRIAAPGTKAPDGAVVVDLGGAFLMPGLQDAHGHLLGLGMALEQVNLVGTKSYDEVIERVMAAAENADPGSWIIGRGWDQNDWRDKSMPHHAELSAMTMEHPVWLVRVDGHAALANLKAMHMAGIDSQTEAPSGGEIRKDDRGEPTGVLIDAAMRYVSMALPDSETEVVHRRLLNAQQRCFERGITCVHDAGVPRDRVDDLNLLHRAKKWRLRTYLMYSASERDAIAKGPWQSRDQLVQVRAVKGYADGALGSYGAALLEPYSDRKNFRGLLLTPKKGIQQLAQLCADSGMQLCVHAIGLVCYWLIARRLRTCSRRKVARLTLC